MKTGLEGRYVVKNNKKLALGYTTGSCATAAAKAAATMVFTGKEVPYVRIETPKGIPLTLEVLDSSKRENTASCAIRKDGGDDPDVTDGAKVYAKVTLGEFEKKKECRNENPFREESHQKIRIHLDGGIGVGRITKPGLEQDIGQAAINKTPRAMIKEAVGEVCETYGYEGDVFVEISVPEGVELAKKTFNPRLGIVGGISILGTSGIVEPMSEEALIASIRLEMAMHRNNGAEYLVISPGNYGVTYLREHFPVNVEKIVKCSNFVGITIDMAVELGFRGILFVSHIGKFIKVAGGIMNTHSRNSDARMEILAANALRAGAEPAVIKEVLEALTTEEGIAVLLKNDQLKDTMKLIMEKIYFYLNNRSYGNLELSLVAFSNEIGELGRIGDVEGLLKKSNTWMEEEK